MKANQSALELARRRDERRRHLLPLVVHGLLQGKARPENASEVYPKHDARLNRMLEDEIRLFGGVALLQSQRHLLERSPLLTGVPGDISDSDIERIESLYQAIDLEQRNRGGYQNLQLTGAYARSIAQCIHANDGTIHPHACHAMGMMRNLCFVVGRHGYHRKDHVTRMFLHALGIDAALVQQYLRPLTVSGGPIRFEDASDPVESRRLAQARCDKHYHHFSLSQKVVELAGTVGKLNSVRKLISFDDMLLHAEDSRSTQHTYAGFVGRTTPATWFSERAAEATLIPEWVNAWNGLYRRIREDFASVYNVDLEAIRFQIGCEYGYAT